MPVIPEKNQTIAEVRPRAIQDGACDVIEENHMIYDRVNKRYGTNIEMRVKR